MKKCLLNVEGGLGKNVMFTSILEEFKTKKGYDEIYVISPYFDVFKCCPSVTDAFPPSQNNLYQELVLAEDCDVYWKEPYSNQRFIKKQCHLFEAWAEELGFELSNKGDEYKPNLSKIETLFPELITLTNQTLEKLGNEFIIVQFCGGQSPLCIQDEHGCLMPYNATNEPIKRNYFKGQEIINQIKKAKPNYKILHFSLPNEPSYEGAEKFQLPYLAYLLLAKHAKGVITTDSSLQHIATSVCDNVTVIWGETRPEHFGYKCNKNVCAKNVINSQAYFKPLGVSPSIVRMPEPEEIIKVSCLCE